MEIVWSRGAFVLRTGEVSIAAADADRWHTCHERSGDGLFLCPSSLVKTPWRRFWTHHAPPGYTGLLSGTRVGSASSASSMRCQDQARAQRGPTPPAVDTGSARVACAPAGRPDTPTLAPPRIPRASWGLWPHHGPGLGWRAPRGCGT